MGTRRAVETTRGSTAGGTGGGTAATAIEDGGRRERASPGARDARRTGRAEGVSVVCPCPHGTGRKPMTFRKFIEQSLSDFEEHLRREELEVPTIEMRLRGA